MLTETINYQCNGTNLKGYIAWTQEARAKRPGIVIAHTWYGLDDFVRQKAQDLAELGYVAMAVDLFGNGINPKNDEEASKLILPLFLDRQLLRDRINAAVDVLKEHPLVEPNEIGGIGFCFGGMTIIELLRSGADVAGVVSFHGLLGTTLGEHKAKIIPDAKKMKGSLLILHGHLDPLVTPEEIRITQEEFTKAGVDWQMNIYGDATHAFTNPMAKNKAGGMMYNPTAAMRSWEAMRLFFEEIFTE